MNRLLLPVFVGVLATLSGCATPLAQRPPQIDYVCEGGGGFRLSTVGNDTRIEYDRMTFTLLPAAGATGEEVLACSMLRVVRRDDVARLEVDGRTELGGCRPRP